jgi:hypothetical protein
MVSFLLETLPDPFRRHSSVRGQHFFENTRIWRFVGGCVRSSNCTWPIAVYSNTLFKVHSNTIFTWNTILMCIPCAEQVKENSLSGPRIRHFLLATRDPYSIASIIRPNFGVSEFLKIYRLYIVLHSLTHQKAYIVKIH